MQILQRYLSLCVLAGLAACQPPPVADVAAPAEPPALLTAQTDTPSTTLSSAARPRQDNILPPVNPLDVRGDLIIAGSNAMAPLTDVLAERFIDEGFAGGLAIERVGSSVGLDIFCRQEKSDIAMASRAITPAEAAACQAAGLEPVALTVGTDALAVVVGADNRFLTDITRQELVEIFTAEYWSDVRPDWPNELIRRTVPEPGSGALNLFVNEVFDGDPKPLLQTPNTDFFGEDEDFLVQALAIDPYAIAFFSYSYYEGNRDTLKLISIDGTSPANRDTYFLIRPLFLYADTTVLSEKPQVAAFLNFFLTHINEEMVALGYFPLRDEQLDKTKQTLLTTIGIGIDDEILE